MGEKMIKNRIPEVTLSNGVKLPVVGYGTYKIKEPAEVMNSVKDALRVGYRHIDTAAFYDNETYIGDALREVMPELGLKREDLFITSKVWKTENTYDLVMASFQKTLSDLQLDYVDLYLVHWPSSDAFDVNWKETNREVWRAMMDIYKSGKARSIGVSNFLVRHLQTIEDMEILPMVDQIEVNPGFLQEDTVRYAQEKGIVVEAWSPMGRGRIMSDASLQEMAAKYGKSVAQLALRWEYQHGIVILPKSTHQERMIENAEIFDFEISDADMNFMDTMAPIGASGHSPDEP